MPLIPAVNDHTSNGCILYNTYKIIIHTLTLDVPYSTKHSRNKTFVAFMVAP